MHSAQCGNSYLFKQREASGIVEEDEEPAASVENYYMPHQLIIRDKHATSTLSFVFDASAKSQGARLNNCLCKGSQLTPLIYDALLSFETLFLD